MLSSHQFTEPTTVCVEASWEGITEHELNDFEGEQFAHISAVISIEVTDRQVTLSTVRTIDAYRRGVPNAGRDSLTIPRRHVEALHY